MYRRFRIYKFDMLILPRGVMGTRLTLDQEFKVRILAGQQNLTYVFMRITFLILRGKIKQTNRITERLLSFSLTPRAGEK